MNELVSELGLTRDEVEPRGRHVGKISLEALDRRRDRAKGKLVLVTAMTPTAHGEGKTTTAIGLLDALRRAGRRAIATIRQPTLGPVFGMKGGGTGGGKSQLAPREVIDLHLSGDSHAVQTAHNLAASFIDNHLHHGNELGIDPATITFPRVLDLSDRALRSVVVGLGGKENGPVREARFEITSASEVMAILALAEGRGDLRRRLGRIVVAERRGGEPVTLEQLQVAGAMAALLHDAIEPNLVQTLEGSPALVHAGPFANIAHGCSSVIADRVALALAELVITEAGFGADLGAEKFFDLKCRASGLRASAAVVVATVRALGVHGAANLAAHVEIVRGFGIPCVVAINATKEDSARDLDVAVAAASDTGARRVVVARPFDAGAEGCGELADAVVDASHQPSGQTLLYPDDLGLRAKLERVATTIYGAGALELTSHAERSLEKLTRDGHASLPVCIAKTPLSLGHDPKVPGRPRGFTFPVRDVRLASGAGFVVAIAGDQSLMPGLPRRPAGEGVDVDERGSIVGLR
ncbi:MAG TPA: formate--tetrahydrofolate ligase [Planctomycetota bacterium]|nr:formate--tetrahydrofolate ligase [Planctomycetota bacterium]